MAPSLHGWRIHITEAPRRGDRKLICLGSYRNKNGVLQSLEDFYQLRQCLSDIGKEEFDKLEIRVIHYNRNSTELFIPYYKNLVKTVRELKDNRFRLLKQVKQVKQT